ncbi:MAG: hypothetical protein ACK5XU_17690 [Pseudomonadota bacterium]
MSPLPHQAAALLEAQRRLAWADAYTRMPALLALAELLPPAQWLAVKLVDAEAEVITGHVRIVRVELLPAAAGAAA